ncbi:MAG: DNA-directed RNA polymerase subunit alpha [Alistipes sp.]|nr:DNA-directed RNA polymerase subunit alpha [Alistipes sp.]
MAILAFQKPEKVIMLESTSTFGKFEFRPLEPGFGMTVGNALRRILLSSLEGYAITTVKVSGVDHEFAAIPGIMEGMIDIILNLKQVRFIRTVDNTDSEKVTVNVAGQTELTAGYISNFLAGFKVLNPDLVICRLTPETKLQIELTIGKGRGYVPAEENAPAEAEFGLLPIDSIHTPIKNVKYSIDNYRVEQRTDYEKLNLEITTDGSIHPKDALKEAAKILIQHFMLFSDEKITLNMEESNTAEEFDEDVLHMRQLLKTKLSDQDLDLSVRALNCLKAAEVDTIGDLVRFNRNDLLKFRNFGKKSLTELDDLLASLNLHFGMDVTPYKLDKD